MTLRAALKPLSQAFLSAEHFDRFLLRYGWAAHKVDTGNIAAVRAGFAFQSLFDTLEMLAQQLESETDNELAVAADLIDTAILLIKAVRQLSTAPPGGLPFPLDQSGFWQEVPVLIIDDLLIRYLEEEIPVLFGVLLLIGLVELEEVVPGGGYRVPYLRRRVRWDRLRKAVSSPDALLREVYRWNDPGQQFDHQRLLASLQRFFWAVGISSRLRTPPSILLDRYYTSGSPERGSVQELSIPLFTNGSPEWTAFTEIGVVMLPIPASSSAAGPITGWALLPRVTGSMSEEETVEGEEESEFFLDLTGRFQVDDGFALVVLPQSISAQVDDPSTSIDAALVVTGIAKEPWILLGVPGSHRIELDGLYVAVHLRGSVLDPELVIEVGTGQGTNAPKITAVIQVSDGDGFLQHLLGINPLRFDFGGLLIWSSKTGLRFSSVAGITLVVPINKTIGPAEVKTLTVALLTSTQGAELTIGVTVDATLGPIVIVVDDVGMKLELVPVPSGQTPGAFGDLDLTFNFKPPTDLSILIDAGSITGGGFISFDETNGRYSGILELDLWEIGVTAIGILDTKDSHGQPLPPPGFSFLIIISVELPNIQLGFGFTLNRVGGLVGIHRTIITEALQSGIRSGSVDHIMFPEDPLGNMPQIISDLQTVFPPQTDRYVFGIMAELGWGTPTIVEVELGIILEFPPPIRLIILGQLNMDLPSEDADIVSIHVDVLGILDTEKKLLSIDASLHDSYVAAFTIYGDMAFRLSWSDQPFFLLSIGGYNPHFQPPRTFPTDLRRATIALGLGDNPRISLQAYLAVSSNSIQFGALAELYAAAGDFNVYGWLSFDALLIFSPFQFRFDFSLGFALRKGTDTIMGIMIEGTLSGPKPFYIRGKACISILFFDLCISLTVTIGERQDLELPAEDPWRLLKPEIEDGKNWNASLPPSVHIAVSLAIPKNLASLTFVQPMGVVTLHQKVLPLNRKLDKFGEFSIKGDVNRYSIDRISIGDETYLLRGVKLYKIKEEIVSNEAEAEIAFVQNFFAPGQFQILTDDQKLSLPSFEEMDSGISIGSSRVEHADTTKTMKVTKITYETCIIMTSKEGFPSNISGVIHPVWRILRNFFNKLGLFAKTPQELEGETLRIKNPPPLSQSSLQAMSRRSAKALSPLSHTGSRKFVPDVRKPTPLFSIKDEEYVVVSTFDLGDRPELLNSNQELNRRIAFDALDNHLVLHPLDRGRLQVMSFYELEMINE